MTETTGTPTFRPRPEPTELSEEYWAAARNGELLYARCDDCGTAQFPKEVACINCLSTNVRWVPGSGRGTVYTYTVIHREPFPNFPVPSTMAIIDLDEGYTMFSSIVGCDFDEITIGMPVEVTFERQDDTISLPMFRPVRVPPP